MPLVVCDGPLGDVPLLPAVLDEVAGERGEGDGVSLVLDHGPMSEGGDVSGRTSVVDEVVDGLYERDGLGLRGDLLAVGLVPTRGLMKAGRVLDLVVPVRPHVV